MNKRKRNQTTQNKTNKNKINNKNNKHKKIIKTTTNKSRKQLEKQPKKQSKKQKKSDVITNNKKYDKKEINQFKNIIITTGIIIITILIIFNHFIHFNEIKYSDGISFKYFYDHNNQVFAKIIISANSTKLCKVTAKYSNSSTVRYFNVTRGIKEYNFEIPNMPSGHTKVLFMLNCSKNLKKENGIQKN